MKDRATSRQLEVLQWIDLCIKEHGYAPSRRELGVLLGIASTQAVTDHLTYLAKKGMIAWEVGKSRTLRLTEAGRKELEGD